MIFTPTHIKDVVVCQPKVHGDHRGYFTETFREDQFNRFFGSSFNFCQDNESRSSYGVLRGLHYQLPPFSQTKLIRVIEGRIWDVAVDLRQGSATFGQSVALELNSTEKQQLLVPRGFAHGFVVLSEMATVAYKVDNYYHPESDRGIAYNDPFLNIDWKVPADALKLSAKDLLHPTFEKAVYFDLKNS